MNGCHCLHLVVTVHPPRGTMWWPTTERKSLSVWTRPSRHIHHFRIFLNEMTPLAPLWPPVERGDRGERTKVMCIISRGTTGKGMSEVSVRNSLN
ncbi:hypothetical protein Bpfe_005059 [Biomphalaria pfeifferi]|uniref:Uncharacterized protein n=1 Tax=Biomphalaria pfeifferi TaxID=112525 RepID=A0AAD8C362_BIOPF|nr:hypothetical protein Bpfe_005059 [Biomphalaria pfeifferi]